LHREPPRRALSEIDRHVASGTMGRVYEGMQVPLERPIARQDPEDEPVISDVRFKKRFCPEPESGAAPAPEHRLGLRLWRDPGRHLSW